MKKLFSLAALLCSFVSIAQITGHEITVKIDGMKDTTCYLANYYGDKTYIQDTVRSSKDGVAVFKGDKKLEGGIYLFVYPDKHYFEMIVDKEQVFTMETNWTDPINNMVVKGSKDNQYYYDYLKQAILIQRKNAPIEAKLADAKTKADSTKIIDSLKIINQQSVDLRAQYIKDHPETFLAKVFTAMIDPEIPKEIPVLPDGTKDSTFAYRFFKAHYFDNVDLTDHRLLYSPVFAPKLKRYIEDYTPQLPDSLEKEADMIINKSRPDSEMFKYCVYWLTYQFETSKVMGVDEAFVHMVETYYMSNQVWWMDSAQMAKIIDRAQKIAPNVIGNTAPEIALKDSAGNWHILSKTPGKFTILVFWNPDCGHCQKDMPVLKQVYDKWKDKGVSVYAVDVEMEVDKWKKYIRDNDLDWINVNDTAHISNFRQMYDIYSTPVFYILDQNKKIRAKRIGVEQIDDLLDRFMKMDFGD